jgi:hypothetical protein
MVAATGGAATGARDTDAARDMTLRVSDWCFTNGNTLEEIAKRVDDTQAKAAQNGYSVERQADISQKSRQVAV